MTRGTLLRGATALLAQGGLTEQRAAAALALGAYPVGIDISKYQPVVPWLSLRFVPIAFVIIKASQGIDFVDRAGKSLPAKERHFDEHWRNATASNETLVRAGLPPLILGTYHVLQWNRDEVEQANAYLAVAEASLGDGFLPPALDVESGPGNGWEDGFAVDAGVRIARWLNVVESRTGKKSIIYTTRLFWSSMLQLDGLDAENHLWLANYDDDLAPDVPAPWSSYTFWQYSDRGRVAGLTDAFGFPVDVDLDRFNGSMADLLKMARAG